MKSNHMHRLNMFKINVERNKQYFILSTERLGKINVIWERKISNALQQLFVEFGIVNFQTN